MTRGRTCYSACGIGTARCCVVVVPIKIPTNSVRFAECKQLPNPKHDCCVSAVIAGLCDPKARTKINIEWNYFLLKPRHFAVDRRPIKRQSVKSFWLDKRLGFDLLIANEPLSDGPVGTRHKLINSLDSVLIIKIVRQARIETDIVKKCVVRTDHTACRELKAAGFWG